MNEMPSILVVDDEEDLLKLLVQRLQRKKYQTLGFTSPLEALKQLDQQLFDLGIFDIKMPEMNGIKLLLEAKERNPEMEVIMLTGHGTIETAIEAMRAGAYDYLTKPYNLQELDVVIQKALEKKQLSEENKRLKEALQINGSNYEIIGEDPKLKHLLEMTRKVANTSVSVLIEGESGTGKELIAKALHDWSDRATQPFIAINSGALMESLIESELFGHVKGAFTGAVGEKKGLIEMAHKGTLFMDEIGEMPLSLQVKLLRFIESGEFRRVGDTRVRQLDTRIIAATNRNLKEEIRKGNFREDLYFRLNVVKLIVPPLRERKGDIPILANFFLKKYVPKYGEKRLSERAMQSLINYQFPGNIREMSHLIERAVLLSHGELINEKDLFPQGVERSDEKHSSSDELISLEELEKRHILYVYEQCDRNKTKAAEMLGISLRNLYRKLNSYGIEQDQEQDD